MPVIEFNPAQLAEARRLLSGDELRRGLFQAVRRTTNKLADQVKQEILRRVPNLDGHYLRVAKQKGDSRAAITVANPVGEVPSGKVTVRSIPLPMIAYRPVATDSGVVVSVGVSTARLRHAFITKVLAFGKTAKGADIIREHKGVFQRAQGRATKPPKLTKAGYAYRLPIKQMYGPPVTTLTEIPAVMAAILEGASAELQRQLDGQVKRFVEGGRK